ncbi:MAG: pro-sigmaK processing inhibitor BofA family protein [Clostridia bacterium]|nr:pro-sigmaK processing inhibitor BofA family protein [Clostridia bacterium]
MSVWSWVLVGVFGGGGLLAVVIALLKSGRPIRRVLSTAVQGICALAAVNVTGMFTGVTLGLGWVTGAVAAVLGLPGVVGLLLGQLIFM